MRNKNLKNELISNNYLKTNNNDYLFEMCRRRLALSLYLEGHTIEDCLYMKKDYHKTYLWSVKTGHALINIAEIIKDLEALIEE